LPAEQRIMIPPNEQKEQTQGVKPQPEAIGRICRYLFQETADAPADSETDPDKQSKADDAQLGQELDVHIMERWRQLQKKIIAGKIGESFAHGGEQCGRAEYRSGSTRLPSHADQWIVEKNPKTRI